MAHTKGLSSKHAPHRSMDFTENVSCQFMLLTGYNVTHLLSMRFYFGVLVVLPLLFGPAVFSVQAQTSGTTPSLRLATRQFHVESFTPAQFSYSMMSALFGSCIWNIIATYQSLPVSSTHAIIGSLIAVGIVQDGFVSVGWAEVGETCLSWVLSPAVGMSVSFCTYIRFQVI